MIARHVRALRYGLAHPRLLWEAATHPVVWRLAVGGGMLIAALAVAYVPGLAPPDVVYMPVSGP